MIALVLRLASAYWREAAIGALALGLMASCVARDHRIAKDAVAQHELRQADSVLRVVTPERIRAETVVVHDTVKVRVAIDRVRVVRDTVLLHLSDTVRVKEYIAATDSALGACAELAHDCATYRQWATQEIAALKQSRAAVIIPAEQAGKYQTVLHWAELGAAFYLGTRVK